jgi:hypothetical protein
MAMTDASGYQFIHSEHELFNSLIHFNKEYIQYLDCLTRKKLDNSITCHDNSLNQALTHATNMTTAHNNIDINTLQQINDTTIKGYNSIQKDILNTYYNNILHLRGDLDNKLNILYQTNNSFLSDYKREFDTSVYTGILWTILATSLLYYVFTKV